jgi:hypothetical protein
MRNSCAYKFTGQPNPQLAEFIESGAENGSIFGDLLPTIRKRKQEQDDIMTWLDSL